MKIINQKNCNFKKNRISKNAIKVLYRLKKTGYQAYLVGGSVRDLLLGKTPKDFDITTNATPEQLRKIFKNCRLVGKRFQIAHVMFQTEFIEVSTFRGHQKNILKNQNNKNTQKTINGMLLSDNIFGNIEEDTQRRDITINALYYDINHCCIRDYVKGINDLKKRIIRLIGDPETRYREDPIRILRVIRFAVQLNMRISKNTAEPISRMAVLLKHVPSARLFNEIIKILKTGETYNIYQMLQQFNLIQPLSLFSKIQLSNNTKNLIKLISVKVLKKIDTNIKTKKNYYLIPEFLFASILWYLQIEMTKIFQKEKKMKKKEAFLLSINIVLSEFSILLALPKQILLTIKEIWKLQFNINTLFNNLKSKFPEKKIFYQASQLLLLRAEIEKNIKLQKTAKFLINKYE